jgi:hypothetical protein
MLHGLSKDIYGNIYAAGYFVHGYMIFGNDTLLNPDSSYNYLFISKYDASGNVFGQKVHMVLLQRLPA